MTAAPPSTAGTAIELVIKGNGYFVVRDPESHESHATQAGHFSIDENGYVLSGGGARLQGRTGGTDSTPGDMQINNASLSANGVPGRALLCHTIDKRGIITAHLTDGGSFCCGQVLLQNFQDPQALVSEGNDLYSNLSAAGPLPALAAPGSKGLGAMQTGILELSTAGQTCRHN